MGATVPSNLIQLITVRRFDESVDSYERLTDLLHRGYAKLSEAGLRYHASYQSVEVTRERCAKGECYVAEYLGQLIATITFRGPGQCDGAPCYDDPTVASFEQFTVDPEFQRQGVARRLLDLVEETAKERGASAIVIDTSEKADDLIAMYRRRGYDVAGAIDWQVTNYRSVVLRKTIAK